MSSWAISAQGTAGAVFTRATTNSAFDASDGTFAFRVNVPLGGGGGVIGGLPSSIVMNYAFTDLTFDRIRGQSTLGNTVQKLDMRRPTRAIACRAALPVRITPNPTPQPTPAPTPSPTPQPTPSPTPAPITSTTTTTTTVTVRVPLGPSTARAPVSGAPSSNSNLPIGSDSGVPGNDVGSDEPVSGATIGLVIGGVGLLLIGGAIILCVVAKRRRERTSKSGDDASAAATAAGEKGDSKAKGNSGAELKDRTYSSVSLVNAFVTENRASAVASGDDDAPHTSYTIGSASSGGGGSNYSEMPMRQKPDVANRPAAPLPPTAETGTIEDESV